MKINVMNQERYKRASQFFIFSIILTILAGIVTFIIHPELKNGAGDSLDSTGLTIAGLPHTFVEILHIVC